MRPVSDELAAALRQSHTYAVRVSVLDPDLVPVAVLATTVGGSVSTDRDRRRAVSLTVANPGGMYTPYGRCGDPGCTHPEHLLNWGRLLRVERGVVLDGSPEYVTLGTFIIDRPQTGASTQALEVQGQDRLKRAMLSAFTRPTIYEFGTAVGEVLQSIARDAGMGDTLYRIDDGGRTLPHTVVYEVSENRVAKMRDLAQSSALTVYVDADGYLVVEPVLTTDSLPPAVWTFARTEDSVLLDLTKDWSDDDYRNHTLVIGEAADQRPVSAEARDLNPLSPGYNPPDGSGPLGDRLDVWSSPLIRDQQLAQDVANARLLQLGLVEESISVPTVVVPHLEVGDVVSVSESVTRTNDDYLIDTLTIPLGNQPMSFTSRRIRPLSSVIDEPGQVPVDPTPPAQTGDKIASDIGIGVEAIGSTLRRMGEVAAGADMAYVNAARVVRAADTAAAADDTGRTLPASEAATFEEVGAVVVVLPDTGVVTTLAEAFGDAATVGWGTADTGGDWLPLEDAAAFSVVAGAGRITVAAGSGNYRTIMAEDYARADAQYEWRWRLPVLPVGADTVHTLMARFVDHGNHYRVECRVDAAGLYRIELKHIVGSVTTSLVPLTATGITVTAGTWVRVRAITDAQGIRAMTWLDGGAVPSAWLVSSPAYPASLQVAASVALQAYANNITNGPLTWEVDDIAGTAPAATAAPTATDPAVADDSTSTVDTGLDEIGTATDSAVLTTGIGYAELVLSDAPVAYWRLGETTGPFVDLVGGLQGTANGTMTRGVTGAIPGDKAVDLDGSTGYVSVPDAPALDVGDFLSVEAWFRRDSLSGDHTIIAKGQGAFAIQVDDNPSGNKILWRADFFTVYARSSVPVLADGVIHHIVCTKGGSDVHIYLDGVDVTVLDETGTLVSNSNQLAIGRQEEGGGIRYFDGLIDEVAIYNYPLAASRVAAHYAAGTTGAGNDKQGGDTGTGTDAAALSGQNNKTAADTGTGTDSGFVSGAGEGATAALLVVADAAALTTGDQMLQDHLRAGLGLTVTMRSDETAEGDLSAYDVIVVAESCNSGTLGSKYKTTAKGVVHMENGAWDDHGLIGTGTAGSVAAQTQVSVVGTHAVRWDVPTGTRTVATAGFDMKHSGNLHGSGAVPIAALTTAATSYVVFAYDAGATMGDGTSAAGRRVAVGFPEGSYINLAEDGWALFDAAVRYARGLANPSFARNALFVRDTGVTQNQSEHCVQSRLRARGYAVTTTDDTALTTSAADSADLVVMSKTVLSTEVGTKLRATTTGVIFWEDNQQQTSMIATIDNSNVTGTGWHGPGTNIGINASAPTALRAGLTGTPAFYRASGEVTYAPNTNGGQESLIAAATRIAEFSTAGQWCIYVVAAGATLSTGSAAVGKRAYFGLYDDTFRLLTNNGVALFDALMDWARD